MIGIEFIQAGSFNVRLALETPVESADGCGGTTTLWQPAFDVWVRLVPVKGVLIQRAQNDAMNISHWIILRHRSGISRQMRFVSRNGETDRIFEIDTIHDPDETGRYLLCETREIE